MAQKERCERDCTSHARHLPYYKHEYAMPILFIAAEASEPAASERRSNTNMCRWGFLSQNILAQWIVVMRDRKCAVSHSSVVFPRHGTLRSLKTYKDILDLH